MKKKIWIVALSLMVLVGFALGAGIVTKAEDNGKVQNGVIKVEDSTAQKSQTVAKAEKKLRIGVNNAKKIALSKVSGKVQKVELEHKKSVSYYEVDINKDNQEYDVYIEAYTGKVLKVKHDDNGSLKKNHVITTTTTSISSNITMKQAITIAENHVNGKLIKVEKETEHGVLVYKVKLNTPKGQSEVYVQRTTGKILKVKTKRSKDDDDDYDDDDNDDDDDK
jgi:uncharacterized membrane protein YkoI